MVATDHRNVEMGSVSPDRNRNRNRNSNSNSSDSGSEDREEMVVAINSSRIIKPALLTAASPAKKLSFKPHHANSDQMENGTDQIRYNNNNDNSQPNSHDRRNNNYTFLKTKSGSLERQITRLYSRRSGPPPEDSMAENYDSDQDAIDSEPMQYSSTVSATRYFTALTGPELETVRDSEELLLPDDKQWPLLLRIPIVCFGVSLGLGTQTMLWKTLATTPSMQFLHIPLTINLALWCLAVAILTLTFIVYGVKCVFYFEAVKREYYHPVRINFFFAPWISCMFLTLGLPPSIGKKVDPILWCVFMAPIFVLELKIYGQWLSGGQRRLSKIANPSTHLSVVGNFVGALLAGVAGWKEPALFFWTVGVAHYLVLFVTLYQRLPTAAVLPKDLHPVFFLFVAPPSTASVAWKSISTSFDPVSRFAFFIALFLFLSLVVRINFFRGFTFSFSWWAYTFPMTAAAIASIHYSIEVKHPITQGIALLLSSISVIVVSTMFVLTLLHGLVWGTLFPNDRAIAIAAYKKDLHNNSFTTAQT